MAQIVNKKIKLNLTKVDGNAFFILGAFSGQARQEGWTNDEIEAVRKEAIKGDYNHLLGTIMDHCKHGGSR